MENIFFLVLVAVVGLLRWLSQAAENKRNAEAEKQSGAPQSEEERTRKFLEALGVPSANAPPPKVQPRQITPKQAPNRKFLPVDPFPVPRGRATEPPSQWTVTVMPPPTPSAAPSPVPPPLPTSRATVPITTQSQPLIAPEFEVHEVGALQKPKSAAADGTLLERLATGQGLRDAIILREIFGPPRSMRPFNSAF